MLIQPKHYHLTILIHFFFFFKLESRHFFLSIKRMPFNDRTILLLSIPQFFSNYEKLTKNIFRAYLGYAGRPFRTRTWVVMCFVNMVSNSCRTKATLGSN